MTSDLANWKGCAPPKRRVMDGRFVRLEPLDPAAHGDGLFAAVNLDPERFRYLPEEVPQNRESFQHWLDQAGESRDPLYFSVIDKASGKVGGRQTFLRIDTANGVIETGHILWTSIVARRPAATEAFFLFARHVFDDLGYRRFEWKCDNRNEPSKRAAIRFGMSPEGVFRQAAVIKAQNRDTAWYSMIDTEWPVRRDAFVQWLDPDNFDERGMQRQSLSDLMQGRSG